MGNKLCLTKALMAEEVYSALPIDRQKAVQVIEDYIELVKEALEQDGKVMLSGFGAFETREKQARPGRNPATGEPLPLRARRVVKFKPSQILRRAINNESDDGSTEE